MNEAPFFRGYLYTALAHKAKMPTDAVDVVCSKFDKLAKVSSPELAFSVAMEAYGNEDTKKACLTVRELIKQEIAKLNKKHPGIDTNPVSRLRDLIERFNANLDKCAVEIDGIPLERETVEKQKIRIPGHAVQPKTPVIYSAQAKCKDGKSAKLTLEIKY